MMQSYRMFVWEVEYQHHQEKATPVRRVLVLARDCVKAADIVYNLKGLVDGKEPEPETFEILSVKQLGHEDGFVHAAVLMVESDEWENVMAERAAQIE